MTDFPHYVGLCISAQHSFRPHHDAWCIDGGGLGSHFKMQFVLLDSVIKFRIARLLIEKEESYLLLNF